MQFPKQRKVTQTCILILKSKDVFPGVEGEPGAIYSGLNGSLSSMFKNKYSTET